MSRQLSDDLGPDVHPEELASLEAVGSRLNSQRPLPSPGFRARLGAELKGNPPRAGRRPARLGPAIAGYLGSGALLLAVAGVGLLGIGPFAA